VDILTAANSNAVLSIYRLIMTIFIRYQMRLAIIS